MCPEICICPIRYLYSLQKMEHVATIVCSSYPLEEKRLAHFQKLLILQFDDIIDINRTTAFHADLAVKIRSLVDQLDPETTKLYVCCDSGESRSTALAAAIMRYYNMDDMVIWNNPHYHPNPLVYRLQCRIFQKPISSIGLKYRLWCNRRALRRAIKNAQKH